MIDPIMPMKPKKMLTEKELYWALKRTPMVRCRYCRHKTRLPEKCCSAHYIRVSVEVTNSMDIPLKKRLTNRGIVQ